MAALEKIRNLSGLLIAVVGIALLSFILGDFFGMKSGKRGDTNIAVINGEQVDYYYYHQRLDETVENYKRQTGQNSLDDRTMNQLQDQVWDQIINKIILDRELASIGITISKDELFDMVQGNNVHPEIMNIQLFQDPTTGIFDSSRVIEFLKNLDADPSGRNKSAWISFEDYLINQQKNNKFFSAINKGIYVTENFARQSAIDKQSKVDLQALVLLYTDIPDSTISVSEKEIEAYYSKNKESFKQELTADIEYVVFPIEPSPKDIENIIAELEDFKIEFSAITDNENYVNANSDGRYDRKFYSKGEFHNSQIDSIMFTSSKNVVYGPYFENEMYKISKLVNKEEVPDSIQISEILIIPTSNEEINTKRAEADSLLALIKEGTKIESLARHSAEPITVFPKWIQTRDMPYSESILLAKKGETFLETGADGFHIVQIMARGKEVLKIQIATLERHITSSEHTRAIVYQKANAFAASIKTAADFEQTILDNNYVKRLANALTPTTNEIRGLDNARILIRETFFAKEKNLILQRSNNSPLFELGENYVVALLTKRNEEGYTPITDVKPKIETAVIKEKKAAEFISKIKNFLPSNDLEQLAEQVGGTVKDVPNLTFASFSVPGIGVEPKINGIAMVLEVNEISTPIEGNNGVYLIKVTQKHPFVEEEFDFVNEVASLRRQVQSRTNSEIQKMLKDNAKIVDNRLMYNR